jgi:hypothetical protein
VYGNTGPGIQRWFYWWTGQEWIPGHPNLLQWTGSPVGANMPDVSFDDGTGPSIYGRGQNVLGQAIVIRWRGDNWEQVGLPWTNSGAIPYLKVLDTGQGPELYAFGDLSSIANVPVSSVVRWNGSTWVSVGPPVQQDPNSAGFRDLEILDRGTGPVLYAMRPCCTHQGNHLFRFNGSVWEPLGGPSAPPNSAYGMYGLVTFDDGRGPALYIMGGFSFPSIGIARFDGTSWEPLGVGTLGAVRAAAAIHGPRGPALVVGGMFQHAGGGMVEGLAQWVGCPNCYANCDLSTAAPVVNVADFGSFLQKYARNDPFANCNLDSAIDIADFVCFLQKFAVGCP